MCSGSRTRATTPGDRGGCRPRATHDARLLDQIRLIHTLSRRTYGASRIHWELTDAGERIGRKRVARLIRGAGIRGLIPSSPARTWAGSQSAPGDDLVRRRFTAAVPNRVWVADLIY